MDIKPSTQNSNPNPNSVMAFHFLKALTNIQQSTTTSSSSSFFGRSRRINRAAYTSMAIAAGPRRAWSQALLNRLRRRRMRQQRRARVSNRFDTLRMVVPGGTGMELCSLLEETASYVQCLRDQVTLMQSIVDAANYC